MGVISTTPNPNSVCSSAANLAHDLDETSRYLHDQKTDLADIRKSTPGDSQTSGFQLTAEEAAKLLTGCYHQMLVVVDDVFLMAQQSDQEMIYHKFGKKKEQLQHKIDELERASSDPEASRQIIDGSEVESTIDAMISRIDKAKDDSDDYMALRCSSSGSAITRRQTDSDLLNLLTGILNGLFQLLGIDICILCEVRSGDDIWL